MARTKTLGREQTRTPLSLLLFKTRHTPTLCAPNLRMVFRVCVCADCLRWLAPDETHVLSATLVDINTCIISRHIYASSSIAIVLLVHVYLGHPVGFHRAQHEQ